jgi:ankyrin repeat protein
MTKHLSNRIVKAVKKGDVKAVKRFLYIHKNHGEVLNAPEKHNVSTGIFKLGKGTGIQNDHLPHMAIRFGHLDVLSLLVACNNINLNLINRNSDTPLSLATQYRNIEAIKILFTSPFLDVNVAAPYTGQTALMTAAQMGNMEIVKLLMEHGANKELRNMSKYTAAQEATAFNHQDICDYINAYQPQTTAKVVTTERQHSSPTPTLR